MLCRCAAAWLFLFCGPLLANPQLDQMLDDIWHFELTTDPLRATRFGLSGYADKLADLSPAALASADQQRRSFLHKLSLFDRNALNEEEKITLAIQQRELQSAIDAYAFNSHFMPLTSEYGFHSALAFLPKDTSFNEITDYRNYLHRLAQFPRYFTQQITWMRQGIDSGFTQPKAVLVNYQNSVSAFIHPSPEQSVFYQPFQHLAQTDSTQLGLTEKDKQALLKEAQTVISASVYSAYQAYYDFLLNEYLPAAKDDIAAKSWPQGEAYYQNQANYYTTLNMSVNDIHQLGINEVKRIRADMQAIVTRLKFKGDLNAFIQFLRSDPQFYATSPQALLTHAAYIAKQIDAKLPKYFQLLPRTPYGVAPVPDSIAAKYTTGRYIAPSSDTEAGYYWVNTYALNTRPLYELPALTLHEAVPGHHLQISLAQEMQDLPNIRRYNYISAFGEGWGLYAEYLGKEMGVYTTDYETFGALSYEMWRACRLVVDTGIHIMNWSRQQAIDYMLENTALSVHNIGTEVDRYISWPGQALSYKLGEITIKKLRQQAEQQLGTRFDLRAFHHAVLSHGAIPLDTLEQQIQGFIQSQLGAVHP
jgi:uncharacterized protein (DUF885 family)